MLISNNLTIDNISKVVERSASTTIEDTGVVCDYRVQRKDDAKTDMRKMHNIFRMWQ